MSEQYNSKNGKRYQRSLGFVLSYNHEIQDSLNNFKAMYIVLCNITSFFSRVFDEDVKKIIYQWYSTGASRTLQIVGVVRVIFFSRSFHIFLSDREKPQKCVAAVSNISCERWFKVQKILVYFVRYESTTHQSLSVMSIFTWGRPMKNKLSYFKEWFLNTSEVPCLITSARISVHIRKI